ncbi:hypothetical protein ACKKBF_B41220 [Auxenochlorella protothecoides x Auxenochlorella symbiontica]
MLVSDLSASPNDEIWQRERVALEPIIADGSVSLELATSASTTRLRSELAARGPTAMAMSALRALQAARSVDANAALTSALLCAGPTLSAFLSSGLDGGEGSLQPMCVLELVCTASATQDPSLRQAPHPMARTLLGISMAVVDAAQDGPAAVARGFSAPRRIMLHSAICPSYIL